jgi:four helix bundle protein
MGGEMAESPLRDKSYAFALAVVKQIRLLRQQGKEYELTSQLLRSATSIGANVEEANAGQSRKDFVAKLAIARKEANEARYWLRLLRDAEILDTAIVTILIEDCEELIRMLTASVKTAQRTTSST